MTGVMLSAAPQRKNPPRKAADGFWAKQITLNKTPWLTGPVKRTGGRLSRPEYFDPAPSFPRAIAHRRCACSGNPEWRMEVLDEAGSVHYLFRLIAENFK
jgi:hypothetical protein